MNKFIYSITTFDDNINDIAIRLGDCQFYRDKISAQVLFESGINTDTDHLNVFQLLKVLNRRKDLTVSFYGVKEEKRVFIYSDFFNFDGAFFDAFSFFDDVDSVLMMCEIKAPILCVSLTKHGKILFQFTVDIKVNEDIRDRVWQQDYMAICQKVEGMPNICDIVTSLGVIFQNSFKSDSQMLKYLEKNAIFKDVYVL